MTKAVSDRQKTEHICTYAVNKDYWMGFSLLFVQFYIMNIFCSVLY